MSHMSNSSSSRFIPIRTHQETDEIATALNYNQTQILMFNIKAPIPITKIKKKVETIKLERILDAPNIVDDYYTELLAWNSDNIVAIGLQNSVYLWNGSSGNVQSLDLDHLIRVVHWMGQILIVCTYHTVYLIENLKMLQKYQIEGVCTCDSFKTLISLGDIEGNIHLIDTRQMSQSKFDLHEGTCCGVQFNKSGGYLLTGGNDNFANIWDIRMQTIMTTQSHLAAIKALTWCPFDNYVLTGGGTMDKSILCWNPMSGSLLHHLQTNSQITSLKFANSHVISTHGFPNNELRVWTPQNVTQPIQKDTGMVYGMESDSTVDLQYNRTTWPYKSVVAHTDRVLHSAISPDETVCATLSPDGNLKFWKMFNQVKRPNNTKSKNKVRLMR
eukprot:NODE_179_length_15798_cov_0.379769.p5 type:complete len:386 gc:universal NODE_179_length_15798_cov_0.379769:7714-8871(+)